MDKHPILPQEHKSLIPEDLSALHRALHATGSPRFIYGSYAFLSAVFFGITLFALLDILMIFLNGNPASFLGTALFLGDVTLYAAIGYGFMFCRRWLLTALSATVILKIFIVFYTFFLSHQMLLPTGLFVVAGLLFFLFLTKELLFGSIASPKAIVPFISLLLISFLLGNFGVIR